MLHKGIQCRIYVIERKQSRFTLERFLTWHSFEANLTALNALSISESYESLAMVGTTDAFVAMAWFCDDLGQHPLENWRSFNLCCGV